MVGEGKAKATGGKESQPGPPRAAAEGPSRACPRQGPMEKEGKRNRPGPRTGRQEGNSTEREEGKDESGFKAGN